MPAFPESALRKLALAVTACAVISCFPALEENADGLNPDFDVNDFTVETCALNDAACYAENLVFSDNDGDEIRFIELEGNLPQSDPDSITVPEVNRTQPARLRFDGQRKFKGLSVNWDNPNGGRPAFCFQLCPLGSFCRSPVLCTPSQSDGQVVSQARWRLFLAAVPQDEAVREVFELLITPLAASNGRDPLDIIEFGETGDPFFNNDLAEVRVGETVRVPVEITAGPDEDPDFNSSDAGQACIESHQCENGACFSGQICEFVFFNQACRCDGQASTGTCGAGACSGEGQACGFGSPDCCLGLSCTNGTCEGAGGRCPLR